MNKIKLTIIYLVVFVVVLGLGFWLYKTSQPKTAKDLPGQTFESQGQEHIDQGSTEHPAYSSNPPTSGSHWPQPAEWGVYKIRQPDEQLIHNLEHGGIWISYNPEKVDTQTISKLEDFSNRYKLIVVEPRETNDSAIVLAAWMHLQNLDSYNETVILKFIEAYYNQGPEKVM